MHLYGAMGQVACEQSIDMCHREAVAYVSICREAYLCARVYNGYGGREEIGPLEGSRLDISRF